MFKLGYLPLILEIYDQKMHKTYPFHNLTKLYIIFLKLKKNQEPIC